LLRCGYVYPVVATFGFTGYALLRCVGLICSVWLPGCYGSRLVAPFAVTFALRCCTCCPLRLRYVTTFVVVTHVVVGYALLRWLTLPVDSRLLVTVVAFAVARCCTRWIVVPVTPLLRGYVWVCVWLCAFVGFILFYVRCVVVFAVTFTDLRWLIYVVGYVVHLRLRYTHVYGCFTHTFVGLIYVTRYGYTFTRWLRLFGCAVYVVRLLVVTLRLLHLRC